MSQVYEHELRTYAAAGSDAKQRMAADLDQASVEGWEVVGFAVAGHGWNVLVRRPVQAS